MFLFVVHVGMPFVIAESVRRFNGDSLLVCRCTWRPMLPAGGGWAVRNRLLSVVAVAVLVLDRAMFGVDFFPTLEDLQAAWELFLALTGTQSWCTSSAGYFQSALSSSSVSDWVSGIGACTVSASTP